MCELSFRCEYETILQEAGDAPILCRAKHYRKLHKITGIPLATVGPRISKRLIALLVAATILLLSACAAAFHAKEIGCFFASFYEENIRVNSLDGDDTPRYEIETRYVLGYVPEGFVLDKEIESSSYSYYEWKGEGENTIAFRQKIRWESVDFTFDNTQRIDTFHINIEVYHFEDQGFFFWFWKHDGYYFVLEMSTKPENAELERIIAGITPSEN